MLSHRFCYHGNPSETPLGEGGTKIADVAALEKILHLLMEDPDEHLPPALEQFFTHLGVRSWEDMVVFSAHDVEEEIKESKFYQR